MLLALTFGSAFSTKNADNAILILLAGFSVTLFLVSERDSTDAARRAAADNSAQLDEITSLLRDIRNALRT